MSLKTDAIIIAAGVVVVGLTLYYVKKKVEEVGSDVVNGAAHAINPLDRAMDMGSAVDTTYKWFGKNNTTPGADTRKIWSIPRDVSNEEIRALPMGAGVALDVYQWITGSNGNQVADFNRWWDGLGK